MRMATLSEGGRITEALVKEESRRLLDAWNESTAASDETEVLAQVLTPRELEQVDPFDQVQLAEVVRVCRSSSSLSDAGRKLFAVSRKKRTSFNDADRLKKYLGRFGLAWTSVRA
jgi:transcriptional regulatory protein RtcR